MTATQDLLALPSPVPKVKLEEVSALVAILRETGQWMTRAELETIDPRYNERRVRAIAEAGRPQIVSHPGSQGYKFLGACTLEEINHCVNTWRALRVKDYEAEVAYLKAWHQRRVA
jgi:hypothetical protein